MHRSEPDDRVGLVRMTVCMISGLLLWAACSASVRGARAESLEEKLSTVTDYVPKAIAPVDQLVEVARRFKIPMRIEWVERAGPATPAKTPPSGKRSVRKLIEEIVSVSPEYRVEVDRGLLRIYSPTEAVHPFNLLNILLESYSVNEGDLFDAENQLGWALSLRLGLKKNLNGNRVVYGNG